MVNLKHLKVVNFCNHLETEIQFNRINIFQGLPSTGKTPVIDAMKMAITGYCRNMTGPEDKDSKKYLVKNGSDDFLVTLQFEHESTEYKVESSLESDKIFQNGEALEDTRLSELLGGIDVRQLDAVFNCYYFLYLSPTERKQFVFDIFGLKITGESLQQSLEKHISQELIDIISPIIEKDGFETAHRKALDWVKVEKDKINNAPEEPDDEDIVYRRNEIKLSQLDSKAIESDLKDLDEQKADLNQKIGALRKQAEFDAIAARQSIIDIMSEIDLEREKIKGYQPVAEIEKRNASVRDDLSDIQKQLENIESEIDRLSIQKSDAEAFVHSLVDTDICPICESKIDDSKKLIAKIRRRLNQITSKLSDKTSKKDQLCEANKENSDLFEKNVKTIQKIKDTTANIDKLESQKAELKKEIEEKADRSIKARENIKNNEETISKINKAVTILRHVLTKHEAFEAQFEKFRAFEKEREQIENDVEIFEKLAELIKPNGVIIKEITTELLKPINDRLNYLNGYNLTDPIRIDSDFSIWIGDRHERQIHRRSSEFFRVGIIFSEAFSFLSQSGIWIVDGSDILDTNKRIALLQLVSDLSNEYANIIITATKDEPKAIRPGYFSKMGLPGNIVERINYYWIEDGKVSYIPPMDSIKA